MRRRLQPHALQGCSPTLSRLRSTASTSAAGASPSAPSATRVTRRPEPGRRRVGSVCLHKEGSNSKNIRAIVYKPIFEIQIDLGGVFHICLVLLLGECLGARGAAAWWLVFLCSQGPFHFGGTVFLI